MKKEWIVPIVATVLTVGLMGYQARVSEPVLAAAPVVRLGEIEGMTAQEMAPSDAELKVLPKDTQILKKAYTAADGNWYLVTAVVGGMSKSSIHRPELCLPSQGFQMVAPHTLEVGGTPWRVIRLEQRDAATMGFAYTFFNQDGYRASSHVKRIFRDILDRTFKNQIDRWVMVTINSTVAEDEKLAAFMKKLEVAR